MAESGLEAVSASAMDGIGRMKRSKWWMVVQLASSQAALKIEIENRIIPYT